MPDSTSTGKPRRPTRRPVFTPRPLHQTEGPPPDAPLDEVRLTVGVISGAHGIEGEMKVRLTTDDPDHLMTIRRFYVGDAVEAVRHRGLRMHSGVALLKLPGVTTPESAKGMTGTSIRIAGSDARPLAANEYYLYQVVGLAVTDEAGTPLGTVVDILETGANDVFVVRPADGSADMLLPSIPDVVVDLRPADGVMVVRRLTFWGDE